MAFELTEQMSERIKKVMEEIAPLYSYTTFNVELLPEEEILATALHRIRFKERDIDDARRDIAEYEKQIQEAYDAIAEYNQRLYALIAAAEKLSPGTEVEDFLTRMEELIKKREEERAAAETEKANADDKQ